MTSAYRLGEECDEGDFVGTREKFGDARDYLVEEIDSFDKE